MSAVPPGKTSPSQLAISTTIVLIGAALRIAMLTDNRLHPDEALFGALARLIVTGQDPLLAHTSLLVDKPPLLYYTLAAGITMSWASELTLRLPGLFASLISLVLAGRLSWVLWRSQLASVTAMLFYALSPFAISFAPTAFADPLMVMWLLAATVAAVSGRWGWGGLLFGLAFATKQNAVFFTPLVVGLGIACSAPRISNRQPLTRLTSRFLAGLAAVVILLLIWDYARQGSISTWQAAVAANNPGRLIRSRELLPRAAAWWDYLSVIGGSSHSFAGLTALLVIGTVVDARRAEEDRRAATNIIIVSFALGYLAMLWLVAFPVLDRYLLGIVPVGSLLTGRLVSLLESSLLRAPSSPQVQRLRVAIKPILLVFLTAVLIGPALHASRSALAVGGDHGAHDGIDTMAAYAKSLPDGTIVYYDSLGWTLAYYLFDAYVVPVSVGSPAALRDDLETFGSGPEQRYLLLPGWLSHQQMLDSSEAAGFDPQIVFETTSRSGERSFVLYRLDRGK